MKTTMKSYRMTNQDLLMIKAIKEQYKETLGELTDKEVITLALQNTCKKAIIDN